MEKYEVAKMTYYIGSMPVTPYLEHFGILGMKWGVRRYQNPDGTLTAAGKARYGVGEGDGTRHEARETLKKTGTRIKDNLAKKQEERVKQGFKHGYANKAATIAMGASAIKSITYGITTYMINKDANVPYSGQLAAAGGIIVFGLDYVQKLLIGLGASKIAYEVDKAMVENRNEKKKLR